MCIYGKLNGIAENIATYLSAYRDASKRCCSGIFNPNNRKPGAGDVGLVDGESTIDSAGRAEQDELYVSTP